MDRIIGFDTQLLVQMCCQFLNALVCVAILYYFLYKPVKKFMAARTEKIDKQISQTKKKLDEADKLKNEYKQKLQEIEHKQNKMLEAAHKQAVSNRDLIIYEARREALKIRERAKLEIEYEKQQIKADMKNQIINVSWIIASNFMKENLNDDIQNKLAQHAISKMGEMKW